MLSHAPGAVTAAIRRRTFAWLRELSVGSYAGLRVHTPEVPGVGRRHRWVVLHADKHPLPSQTLAEVWMVDVEAICCVDHFAPPPAAARRCKMINEADRFN